MRTYSHQIGGFFILFIYVTPSPNRRLYGIHMIQDMKKALVFTTYMAIALLVAGTLAHAETATTSSATVGVVAGATTIEVTPTTLTERKAAADKELTALEAQFRLFATRTQITIDRLTIKGVDTKPAQIELTKAVGSLDTAKANLDLFAKIAITDDMTEEAIAKTELKPTLTKIQDSLKDAREQLIQSLSALKASLSVTLGQ